MNYEKALSLYSYDKTLQLLRAEYFPLLVSFFHLAFKQQDRISYPQSDLNSLLGDYLFSLERSGIADYRKSPLEYLQRWAQQGYLRRYYESGDEPVYELSPSTENALKWLEDLNKQEFVGTHSRLLQFFNLLKEITNQTSGPQERIGLLEAKRAEIDHEITQIRGGNYSPASQTQIKENYMLAEETARRLLSDFRQVEENFRELDTQTRQTIIKSSLAKADLLDQVFQQQDYLWNTDQGKSFRSFWEFLMSESMQQELENLLDKINTIEAIREIRREQVVDRIKSNLVDAGDKVNRSNDGLIEQLRKFVEQKNLAEARHIMQSIESIESLLMDIRGRTDVRQLSLMEIDGLFRPKLIMERPLFSPPLKVVFEKTQVQTGRTNGEADALFDQFYIDIPLLRERVQSLLRYKSQVALPEVVERFKITKGAAEVLGYFQIAGADTKHLIDHGQTVRFPVTNLADSLQYDLQTPLVIFHR